MADLLGVSRQFISYVERGERAMSKEFVAKIDNRLDLTPEKKALIYKIFDEFKIAV
jgi:transcriptional regulator with XRE-family HTH domain